MHISLIITTYNWKEALRVVLASALVQTRPPLEIIVADDGSRADTGELVRGMARTGPVKMIHSWQEDQGFRAGRSRNLAMARAQGDYLVMVDGDMVLEPHFLEDHGRWAREGFFVQGTRALLDSRLTREVLAAGRTVISPFARGVANRKNCIRSSLLADIFSRPTASLSGIRTCNFAFFRKDGVTVNGFNEDFVGWGREDSEFAVRLLNNGIRRRNLRFNGIAYHLHHPEHSRMSLAANDRILAEAVQLRRKWCEHGLNLHLGR